MNRKIWLLILTLLLSISCASNKTTLSSPEPVSSDPLTPMTREELDPEQFQALLTPDKISDFRLGPEDKLEISVRDEKELAKNVIVGPDGNISFPVIGSMKASGKTIDELKSDIEKEFTRFILQPQVGVIVLAFNSKGFYILGKVKKPGYYGLRSSARVLRAISEAGGITPPISASDGSLTLETADLAGAYLVRDEKVLPIDFQKLLLGGDMTQNIPLRHNDFIYIPSALDRKVLVLGEVGSPGSIRFGTRVSLIEAITEAGGHRQQTALLSDIKLIRGPLRNPKIYTVNMKNILAGKSKDLLLERSDIVYVPATPLTTASRVMTQILPFLQLFNTAATYGLNDKIHF